MTEDRSDTVLPIKKNRLKSLNIIFIVFFVLTGFNLQAQQVFPKDYPPTRENFPFFDSAYIKENRIKSLHTEVMYKAPMQKIEHSKESDKLRFNEKGLALFHQRVSSSGDTSSTEFTTNANHLVAQERHISTLRDVTISYTYNDHNDIIEIKETDTKTGVVLLNEKFKFVYEYYDQYKKYWLNNEGLSYKYSIIKIDDKKRIIEERGRYIRGTNKHSIYFVYENDLLINYSSNIKEISRREIKYQMIYNTEGVVVEMNEYRDGAYFHHHEFLYDKGLLVAVLEKKIRTQRIKIIKYKYEVY